MVKSQFINKLQLIFLFQQKNASNSSSHAIDENSQLKENYNQLRTHVTELENRFIGNQRALQNAHQDLKNQLEKNEMIKSENIDLIIEKEQYQQNIVFLEHQLEQQEQIIRNQNTQNEDIFQKIQQYSQTIETLSDRFSMSEMLEEYNSQIDMLLNQQIQVILFYIQNALIKAIFSFQSQYVEEKVALNEQIQKLQNDLSIQNNQIEKLSQSLAQKQYENSDQSLNSEQNPPHSINLSFYQEILKKFSQFDEKMFQMDEQLFSALNEKDFWYKKYQELFEQQSSLPAVPKQELQVDLPLPQTNPGKNQNKPIITSPQRDLKSRNKNTQNRNLSKGQKCDISEQKIDINFQDQNDENQLITAVKGDPTRDDFKARVLSNDKLILQEVDLNLSQNHDIIDSEDQAIQEQNKENIFLFSDKNAQLNSGQSSFQPTKVANAPAIITTSVPEKQKGIFGALQVCSSCALLIRQNDAQSKCARCQNAIHQQCSQKDGEQEICDICTNNMKKQEMQIQN